MRYLVTGGDIPSLTASLSLYYLVSTCYFMLNTQLQILQQPKIFAKELAKHFMCILLQRTKNNDISHVAVAYR